MSEQVQYGGAIDISNCEKTSDGYYVLPNFIDGKDYCDLKLEKWIWSIGYHLIKKEYHASLGTDLYENNEYKCVWLR